MLHVCVWDVSYEALNVTPCRTSPPRRCWFFHVSRETPDVTPCHTSPPQGVSGALGPPACLPREGCLHREPRRSLSVNPPILEHGSRGN